MIFHKSHIWNLCDLRERFGHVSYIYLIQQMLFHKSHICILCTLHELSWYVFSNCLLVEIFYHKIHICNLYDLRELLENLFLYLLNWKHHIVVVPSGRVSKKVINWANILSIGSIKVEMNPKSHNDMLVVNHFLVEVIWKIISTGWIKWCILQVHTANLQTR